jgi:hypothetical protein
MPSGIAVHSMKGMYSSWSAVPLCTVAHSIKRMPSCLNALLLKLNPETNENIPRIDKMRPGVPA